jgi:hypothetical protein
MYSCGKRPLAERLRVLVNVVVVVGGTMIVYVVRSVVSEERVVNL